MNETTSSTQTRAPKGGQTGQNGEHYDGGQFLPNTDLPKGVKKQRAVMVMMRLDWDNTTYADVKGDKFTIFSTLISRHVTCYAGDIMRPVARFADHAAVIALVNRFNAGERWITRAERDTIWNR